MKKLLIITYYWPPSGGSGVQRWMFFSSYLPQFGVKPIVLTVDPKYASYKFLDTSFQAKTDSIRVVRTKSSEPFNAYSKITGKSKSDAIPQGFSGESNPTWIQKISRFIRGNFFIPDARIGWIKYATDAAEKLIKEENINTIITTGPPHSTHLIGLNLKKKFNVKWIADFRDPWTELYYNKHFYRTRFANRKDGNLERQVIDSSDLVLTVGPSMMEMLKKKGSSFSNIDKKFHYIFNGFDEAVFKNIVFKKDPDHFTILHLGVLSDNQPIGGFVAALKRMKKEFPDKFKLIRLKITGKVSPDIISHLEQEVPDINLLLTDYIPHQQAIQEMVNADLLINSLAAVVDGKYLISGKLMEYMATGNPVLCFGETQGDAANLLRSVKNAAVVDRNDAVSIYNFIVKEFEEWSEGRRNSSLNIVKQYTRVSTAAELAQLIDKLDS